MQGILTILILVGLVIAWSAQQKKRAEEEQKANEKRKEKRLQTKKVYAPIKKEDRYEDIRNRHIKGTLKHTRQQTDNNDNSIIKLNKLTQYKKAIIWSEILGKPVGQKEEIF